MRVLRRHPARVPCNGRGSMYSKRLMSLGLVLVSLACVGQPEAQPAGVRIGTDVDAGTLTIEVVRDPATGSEEVVHTEMLTFVNSSARFEWTVAGAFLDEPGRAEIFVRASYGPLSLDSARVVYDLSLIHI